MDGTEQLKCCKKRQVKDLSQGLGDERHYYCIECKSHLYKGMACTRKQWDEYVNGVEYP